MRQRKMIKNRRVKLRAMRTRKLRVLSRAIQLIRRYRVVAVISGILALLASLATIYSVSTPKLVAISPSNTFNGELRVEPGAGVKLWVEGEQRFRNTSLRGGGHVAGIQVVPNSLDAAMWLPTKTVNSNSETFGSLEEKTVKFNALFQFPEINLKSYPQFGVEFQFLDDTGAVIVDERTGKPYSLKLNITESALNSLKGLATSSR